METHFAVDNRVKGAMTFKIVYFSAELSISLVRSLDGHNKYNIKRFESISSLLLFYQKNTEKTRTHRHL